MRFRQFFAVHELEAWLLSDAGIFPRDIQSDILTKAKQPEQVNSEEPPAKLLERLYLSKTGKTYKKRTNGEQLFARLDPETAYQKCPHLKALVEELLLLTRQGG